jgi:hypothetical protein
VLALLIGAAFAPRAGGAQLPQPAVVVQVAGANLYIDRGTDDGIRSGDTVTVRRAIESPPIGALVVVGASPRRSILTFAGPAFAVTRGDTIFITPSAPSTARLPVATIAAAEAQPRAPPPTVRRPRMDGTLGLEMWGSHSETIGLGADPVRTTRDIGMPSIRFSSFVSGERSRFRVNMRVQQRTGPQSVWDRSTRIRIYEARYDLTAGRAQFTAGRFYSDFDHQSAFWDGATVRVGVARGVTAGLAAGFEPERGNEEVSFSRPKVAGFVGTRYGNGRVDLVTDLAFTQTLPSDKTQRRTGADLAMRLRIGRFSLTQDLEFAPPSPSASWDMSRFMLRASTGVGTRGYVYASAVSDRFTPLDTALLLPFARRERVTSGYSVSLSNGTFVDVNASVNNPSSASSGYAAGATVSVPRVLGSATASMHTSWFNDGQGTGFLASPALEYRLGSARLRGGYQFYSVSQPAYSMQTHGVDFRLWKPFGPRSNGVVQISDRFGHNMHNTTVFTSFEVRF